MYEQAWYFIYSHDIQLIVKNNIKGLNCLLAKFILLVYILSYSHFSVATLVLILPDWSHVLSCGMHTQLLAAGLQDHWRSVVRWQKLLLLGASKL